MVFETTDERCHFLVRRDRSSSNGAQCALEKLGFNKKKAVLIKDGGGGRVSTGCPRPYELQGFRGTDHPIVH